MIAFLRAGIPSAGVYLMSPVFRTWAELMIALIGAFDFGSPPPRWMTGSPLSRSIVAVSFSLSVGDTPMERASWLRLIIASYRTTHAPGALRAGYVDGPRAHPGKRLL